MAGFHEKYWLFIAAFLGFSLLTGIIFLSTRLAGRQAVEINLSTPSQPVLGSEFYIGGAVYRPGIYPVKPNDTLTSCIETAGPTQDANLAQVKITVPSLSATPQPQKIDLNRAEAWLLQALPGIGEGRARTIVEYREKNGPFHSSDDLLKIEGFGKTTLDRIREYITVAD